ncbi:MAG TPA: hypothetical protein VHH90_03275 [Polyangia bacterium]|nr:hypothetical protein [Polyangia bacterium]
MRLRARHHGFSTAARAVTLAAVVVASLGQFASLAHEMTVRHFRCAEHGELTHVAAIASTAGDVTGRAGAEKDAWRAPAAAAVDAHEHCGLTFTVEGSAPSPSTCASGRLAPPPPAAAPAAPRLRGGRMVALAAAPKTSPPRA